MAHIQIQIPEDYLIEDFGALLNESKWVPSNIKDLWIRVDPARPEHKGKRHVHIAHKKHINSKDCQVSWNDDGTRHDKSSFDTSFKGQNQAKAIARLALNLPETAILEASDQPKFDKLVQSITESLLNEEYIAPVDCDLVIS